jgi:hypothetical protein
MIISLRLVRAAVLIAFVISHPVHSFLLHPHSRVVIVRRLPLIRPNFMTCSQSKDNDGWANDHSDETVTSPSEIDRIARSKELLRLQNDLSTKRTTDAMNSLAQGSGGEERDMFIPIFTLVAVAGFTGLYGYELLRLYLRGELYLPWQ